jgi:hypothetical protein
MPVRLVGYNQNGRRLIGSVPDDMVTPLGRVEDFYQSGGTLTPSGAPQSHWQNLNWCPSYP